MAFELPGWTMTNFGGGSLTIEGTWSAQDMTDGTSSPVTVVSTAGASMIVVLLRNRAATNVTTIPSGVSGSTLGAFTQAVVADSFWGPGASVWYKASTGALSNEVITATWAANQGWRGITALSFLGAAANPIGVSSIAEDIGTYPSSLTLTGTTSGSFGLLTISNRFDGTPTGDTNLTLLDNDTNGGHFRTTNTGSGGSLVLATTAPVSGSGWSGVAVEILKA